MSCRIYVLTPTSVNSTIEVWSYSRGINPKYCSYILAKLKAGQVYILCKCYYMIQGVIISISTFTTCSGVYPPGVMNARFNHFLPYFNNVTSHVRISVSPLCVLHNPNTPNAIGISLFFHFPYQASPVCFPMFVSYFRIRIRMVLEVV